VTARLFECTFILVGIVATIPEFIWELSLGIYCTVKGFRPSPILGADRSTAAAPI
jgi:hypothetical protein